MQTDKLSRTETALANQIAYSNELTRRVIRLRQQVAELTVERDVLLVCIDALVSEPQQEVKPWTN